jgi:hypothetical protein
MVDQVLDDAPEAESFIMESGDAARGVAFDKSGEVAQARRGISLKFGTGVSIACIVGGLLFAAATVTSHKTGRLSAQAMDERVSTTASTSTVSFLQDDVDSFPESIVKFLEENPDAYGEHSATSSDDVNLDIKLTNRQTQKVPVQSGSKLTYPWSYIAEPYKPTTMSVVNGLEDGAWYKWIVDGHVQSYGPQAEVLFTSTGYHDVVLTSKIGDETKHLAVKVMVKYVRREVRSMLDVDRERFFNALMVLTLVPTEVGQKLWGSTFKSKDYFQRIHLYYGGTKDCDHWHQGAGFVTSHISLTHEFEMAMQAVFPDVIMPYWDFTQEAEAFTPSTWRDSSVFSDSWFGSASPDNTLRTVQSGRFAFTPTKTHAVTFSQVYNSYGLLRAPWNGDPTPFSTRSDLVYGYKNNISPSGCKEYHNAMNKDNWMAMSRQLNSAAHGHIHETMGGAWNSNFKTHADARVGADGNTVASVMAFAHEIQALSKELWRADYISCPQLCSMDTPWKACSCQCDAEKIGDLSAYEVLYNSGVLSTVDYFDSGGTAIDSYLDGDGNPMKVLDGYSEDESNEIYESMLKALCQPGHIGDMFQATSSNDVTFWVLHGTLDRLWHFKRLGNQKNFDETWDPYHTCYGHNPGDYQPFKNLFDEDDRYYSNAELYQLFNPSGVSIPYMYENFEWPHCEESGYTIRNTW